MDEAWYVYRVVSMNFIKDMSKKKVHDVHNVVLGVY